MLSNDDWKIVGEAPSWLHRQTSSTRIYRDRPVDGEKIQQILDVCRYAPTGSNAQQVNWVFTDDQTKIRELSQLTIDWMKQAIATNNPLSKRLPLAGIVDAPGFRSCDGSHVTKARLRRQSSRKTVLSSTAFRGTGFSGPAGLPRQTRATGVLSSGISRIRRRCTLSYRVK